MCDLRGSPDVALPLQTGSGKRVRGEALGVPGPRPSQRPRSAWAHACAGARPDAACSLVFLSPPFHLSRSSLPHALAAFWLSGGKSMGMGPECACCALVPARWLCAPLQGGRQPVCLRIAGQPGRVVGRPPADCRFWPGCEPWRAASRAYLALRPFSLDTITVSGSLAWPLKPRDPCPPRRSPPGCPAQGSSQDPL